jgi:hypothetical protein
MGLFCNLCKAQLLKLIACKNIRKDQVLFKISKAYKCFYKKSDTQGWAIKAKT